jgi:hypothetical protein
MYNPIRALSKKVVDATLATEVKRLRDVVTQQDFAVSEMLAREVMYLAAIQEICEQNHITDNMGRPIVSQQGFIDFARSRAKVQS